MVDICPTVTAYDVETFREQMRVASFISSRVHVDLMDGEFTSTKSPDIDEVWLPHGVNIDIHLMYQKPMDVLEKLIVCKPHMVIVHAEANVHHALFAAELHKAGIKAGLALLADTPVYMCEDKISGYDHALIFSGKLGSHGGHADLGLLPKVLQLKHHHPDLEIAWDGGINEENAHRLVQAGIDVLNVGGFIQSSSDPKTAYDKLVSVVGQ